MTPTLVQSSDPTLPVDSNAEQLFDQLYDRLRRLAHSQLRRNEPITLLDTTGLVHESYLRLSQSAPEGFADRAQFLGYASRVMRFVVIDFIRRRHAQARGGHVVHVTLDTAVGETATLHDAQMIRLHEALDELALVDERLAAIVEMRCFGGLGEREMAQALGITERTVRRHWLKARTLLKAAMD